MGDLPRLRCDTEIGRLESELATFRAELERFKRGELTPEEFHNLCHNKEKTVTLDEFCTGCENYQKQLFGESPISKLKEDVVQLHALCERLQAQIGCTPEHPYAEELAHCDRWIQWCKDNGNDMYGVNFHQGRKSGIIHGNIVETRARDALRAEIDELKDKLDTANASLQDKHSVRAAENEKLRRELAEAKMELVTKCASHDAQLETVKAELCNMENLAAEAMAAISKLLGGGA